MSVLTEHIEHLDRVEGFQITKILKTEDGVEYRVVRLSPRTARVIVHGAERLDINLITEGPDIFGVSESIVGTIVDFASKALDLGIKIAGGGCTTETKVVTTYFENGNIKSSELVTKTAC